MPNKTQPTKLSVQDFLNNYPNPNCTEDYLALDKFFQKVTKQKPVLWGKIVGYGKYTYKYASGRTGDWMISGFAPSGTGMTIYLMHIGVDLGDLLSKLGKHKLKGSCLHISKLSNIDLVVLKQIVIIAAQNIVKRSTDEVKQYKS